MLQRYARLGTRKLAVTAVRRGLLAAPDPGPLDPAGAIRGLRGGGTAVFVCLGNICRSPMAERYARTALSEAGIETVSVRSAGFVRERDRPSPPLAVETARERGVDLSDHGSTPLSPAVVADGDVLLLMDCRNYYDLLRRFPGARDRAYFLRPFTDPGGGDAHEDGDGREKGDGRGNGDGNGAGSATATAGAAGFEIPDPEGKSRETFRTVYGAVAAAIDGFVARLRADGRVTRE